MFLESVAAKKQPKPKKGERIVDGDLNELIGQVETIVEDQDEEQMYASELKDTLTRLRPDFSERSYGCSTFGKLVALIASKSDKLSSWTEDSSLMIGLSGSDESSARMDKSNWLHAAHIGLPIPDRMKDVLAQLHGREDKSNDEKNDDAKEEN